MSNTERMAKSVIMIMVLTLISKILGFYRELSIASHFGSGAETDAYFVAMTVGNIIMVTIGLSLTTILIPVLLEMEKTHGFGYKLKFMNNVVNVVFLVSVLISVFLWLGSPFVIKVLAGGFVGEQFAFTVELNRMGLPMNVFIILTAVFTGFLQSNEKYAVAAAVGIPFNIVYIIFLTFFANQFGIRGLMVASIIAAISQLIIQIPPVLKLGYQIKFDLNIKDQYLKKILFLTGPIVLGSMVQQINTVVDRTLASNLVEGSISALNYANRLNSMVLSVFVIAITTVLFPIISRQSHLDNTEGIKTTMRNGINIILLITIPVMVGIIILAQPMVQVLFERGQFDANDTKMTVIALVFYAIGLVAFGLREILNKVFYSLQDTKTPMLNGIIAVCSNVVLNLILVKYIGHGGLALATSLSAILTTVLLIFHIRKKIGRFGLVKNVICLLKSFFSAGIMGICIHVLNVLLSHILPNSSMMRAINLGTTILSGVVIYTVMCYFLKVAEFHFLFKKVMQKFGLSKVKVNS